MLSVRTDTAWEESELPGAFAGVFGGSSPSRKPGSGDGLRVFFEPLWGVLTAWLGLQAGGMQLCALCG